MELLARRRAIRDYKAIESASRQLQRQIRRTHERTEALLRWLAQEFRYDLSPQLELTGTEP
jgi:ribosome-associated translation inhibitor RaiA